LSREALAIHPYRAAVAWRGLGTGPEPEAGEVELVKKCFVVASVAAMTAVGVALVAGKDDIRRFLRMHSM
jgi:hypothetical protein